MFDTLVGKIVRQELEVVRNLNERHLLHLSDIYVWKVSRQFFEGLGNILLFFLILGVGIEFKYGPNL